MKRNNKERFKCDIDYRKYRIQHLANKYGWILKKNDGEKYEYMDKEGSVLSINYVYLEVATALHHPKWGDTVLKRTGELTQSIIESIFRNPRSHMPKHVKSKYIVQA